MTLRELFQAAMEAGCSLDDEVVVFADHNGHWDAVSAGRAFLRSDEDDYEVDLWHPDDLEEFLKECEEDGEKYEPRAAFVIDGIG